MSSTPPREKQRHPDVIAVGAPRSPRVPRTVFENRYIRPVLRTVFRAGALGLRVLGLYGIGMRNAADIRLTRIDMTLPGLPAAFDGYTILHISDLHADGPVDIEAAVVALIDDMEVDMCALTGDYRYRLTGTRDEAAAPMARIVSRIKARDGVFGVMGNHDLSSMIEPLGKAGITMLINESHTLRRGGDEVHLIGLDDVHAYQPADEADEALSTMPEGYRILLVHSPELLDEAEAHNVALYLCGHTHGGQICLPGGIPLMVNIKTPRRYASGHWHHGRMQGYTSMGAGVSVLPLRYFCRGEVTLITLKRA